MVIVEPVWMSVRKYFGDCVEENVRKRHVASQHCLHCTQICTDKREEGHRFSLHIEVVTHRLSEAANKIYAHHCECRRIAISHIAWRREYTNKETQRPHRHSFHDGQPLSSPPFSLFCHTHD